MTRRKQSKELNRLALRETALNNELDRYNAQIESLTKKLDKLTPDSHSSGDCSTCRHDTIAPEMDFHCNNCLCNFGIKDNYERKEK